MIKNFIKAWDKNNKLLLKEFKRLNYYGKMFGIKRKWYETNKKYSERLK